MRWPFNARIDAVHAWGMVGAGIAVAGIIVGALAATHASESNFHWWWPTNWLIIPVGFVVIGLVIALVPFRHDGQKEAAGRRLESPRTFQQEISATSPGATAQGVMFGNIYNESDKKDDNERPRDNDKPGFE